MTDPERISRRASGLSGELLRAGLDEQPSATGMDRALAALGVSGVVVATSAAAQAGAGGLKLGGAASGATGAVAVKATSTVLLVKWIGIGVVSGLGLAGVASVAAGPAAPTPSVVVAAPRVPAKAAEAPVVASPSAASPAVVEITPEPVAVPSAPRSILREAAAREERVAVGAPLAAEVALIDEARSAVAAGRTEQALGSLARYEREFPEARLLPEALFLRLEVCERAGRTSEARRAAEQLLRGFPKSPHAARARKLLER